MTTAKRPERIPWNRQTADGQVSLSMPGEIIVLGVALLSIVNLALAILVRNPDIEQIITIMDSILIVVFLIDLLRRLHVWPTTAAPTCSRLPGERLPGAERKCERGRRARG